MYNLLVEKMNGIHVKLNDRQLQQFHRFYEMLVEWNKVMNLTGITEYDEIVEKHFVDSLSIVNVFELERINRVLDVGTGAGFPGIPIKIVFPHLEVVLLDSLNKRIKFLDAVIDELEIKKISTIHGRAEDFAKPGQLREQYDLCVSRAVANLSVLSEYCLPYVKVGGKFISYKSEKIVEEMKDAEYAIQVLGGRIGEQVSFTLPDSDLFRNLFVVEKCDLTPAKYPRKAGMASKKPLKMG